MFLENHSRGSSTRPYFFNRQCEMSAARWSNQVVFRWSEGLASGEQTASKERGIILVTGGAGYVGSHACVELLNAGEQVVVFDNFCNSNPSSLDRVQMICSKSLIVVQGDIRDQVALESTLTKYRCTAVLHFAGLKSVQDSVARPLEYYDHNVIGSYRLLCAMQNTGASVHQRRSTETRNFCHIGRIIR